MNTGDLVREARLRRGLDQGALARRAGTTQSYVSRIERGAVSPSMTTLTRLLHSMGFRLSLDLEPLPIGNARVEDLRSDYANSTATERVREAMELSEYLTGVAERAGHGR